MQEKINNYIDSVISYQERMDLLVLTNKIASAPNLEQYDKEQESADKYRNIVAKLHRELEDLETKRQAVKKVLIDTTYNLRKKLKENTKLWEEIELEKEADLNKFIDLVKNYFNREIVFEFGNTADVVVSNDTYTLLYTQEDVESPERYCQKIEAIMSVKGLKLV